ncbi:HNH endonuclease [Streptomyces xiamenensis]|uniref:HNH endonuclease n=1 Tax=Streptomyces xiamenensis TaxID=408015 RepID=UPI0035D87C09
MAVSKRLRYEILRRDNHTCRYCGAAAPDAPLRIDHVTPVALGGTDTADNLVTACEPCNSGKTSTTTDAATVADVKQDALRWAEAMKQAAANLTAADRHKAAYRDAFLAEWNRWGAGKGDQQREIDLPKGWKASIEAFRVAGLPATVWAEVVDTSMGNDTVRVDNKFRYCCGVAWRMVTKLQEDARRIVAGAEGVQREVPAASAIATLWATEWLLALEREPTAQEVEQFRESLDALLEGDSEPDYPRLVQAAAQAAGLGLADIGDGLGLLQGAEEFQAITHWQSAWRWSCGDNPPLELWESVEAQIHALIESGVYHVRVARAAIVAGSRCSARLHHGLSQEELDAVDVVRAWEELADIWSRSYSAANGHWPSDDERKALRQSARQVAKRGGYSIGDCNSAAAVAGAYQDTDLSYSLPRLGSALEAAANPLGLAE